MVIVSFSLISAAYGVSIESNVNVGDDSVSANSSANVKNLNNSERGERMRERIENIMNFENRLRIKLNNSDTCPTNCECEGSVTRCMINGTRQMTVIAGNSGNIIIITKDVNASTRVELYKSDNGTIIAKFKNNETKEIILPDEVKERIIAKLKAKAEMRNMTLDEDGTYYVMMKKKARLFWIIPVNENADGQVDAQTGQVIIVKGPWWGFLAKDE
ncbi:MAG: hypothetical protein AABX48_00160 [Nanoarchaeota archaeon]